MNKDAGSQWLVKANRERTFKIPRLGTWRGEGKGNPLCQDSVEDIGHASQRVKEPEE